MEGSNMPSKMPVDLDVAILGDPKGPLPAATTELPDSQPTNEETAPPHEEAAPQTRVGSRSSTRGWRPSKDCLRALAHSATEETEGYRALANLAFTSAEEETAFLLDLESTLTLGTTGVDDPKGFKATPDSSNTFTSSGERPGS